jgi:predicted membrane chloride channel (bestrophin family)
MMDTEAIEQVNPGGQQAARQRAIDRSRVARWDLNIAIFLFAILITVVILLFQNVSIEIVAPVAIVGLSAVWLVGWIRGKRLYNRFYKEEMLNINKDLRKSIKATVDETIEEKVQKALRERWQ